MENTFRPSRFLSLRATTPSPCTWEEILQELTGERHAAATALFRALAAGEGQDAETSKRQQSQIKQNQPAFVPSVHLEGGRSSKHIKGYPGSIMVDIDGIPEEIFDETLERVRADPHSFLAYKTLSGRGIRVIAWMEGEVTEENFPAAWQTVNAYYARHIDIVCLGEKLLYQLRTALADCHGTERSVSRVGIRSKDHLAACRQHLSGKLVNDCLMRRHIDSAIALCTGQPKHVVILVDGAAHCAEAVVAVRQYIRNWELLQSRCTCCLYDSYERNVVGSQLIKLDLQLVHIAGYIVIL